MRNLKKYITVWTMALAVTAVSMPVSAAPSMSAGTEIVQEDKVQEQTYQVRFDAAGGYVSKSVLQA